MSLWQRLGSFLFKNCLVRAYGVLFSKIITISYKIFYKSIIEDFKIIIFGLFLFLFLYSLHLEIKFLSRDKSKNFYFYLMWSNCVNVYFSLKEIKIKLIMNYLENLVQ